jgi:Holliday junction DNA helicase RuvB
MAVHIAAAKEEGVRLPHTLFASGFPGVGKTSAAYLMAQAMGVRMVKLIPPFNIHTFVDTALSLNDKDILFLDEVHILANNGKRGAEFLLPILEDGIAYLDGEAIDLPDITYIGATTDRDKLPKTIIDRFKIKPYFQAYEIDELGSIAVWFAWRHDALSYIDDEMCLRMAMACQGVPRILDEMVEAAKALTLAPIELTGTLKGVPPSPEQLLEFLEVEPDGTTRDHIEYITALLQYHPREKPRGEGVEFIAGESTMMQRLRQTKQGIGQIENFLIDRGLIDRTPRGRRLTSKGIGAAMSYIVQGKGAAAHG